MTRSHGVLFLCALLSFPAYSGSVTFAQWIPWSFVSSELERHDLEIREERPSLSLDLGEFKPELRNISVIVRGRVGGLTSVAGILRTQIRGSLSLRLGSLHVDQFVRREFGGNVINVRIQASCSAVTLEIPSVSLLSEFSLQGGQNHLPMLRDFTVGVPANQWSVSPVHCEGLSGIGEEIKASLNSALRNPEFFSPLLREWIAPRMDQWIRDQWPLVATGESWSDLRIGSADERGLFLRGEIPLYGSEEVDLPEELPGELIGERPKFFLSQEGYEALIQDRLRALLPSQYDLRENASFRKLLNSRLMQFFAWPDLRRFHSSTPFVLKNDPSSLRLTLSSSNALLSGKGSLVTLIGGSPIDYITYSMNLSVPLKTVLQNGDLSFSTGKAQAKITWSFGHLYQLLYKPDKRIPVEVLTSSLADLASNQARKIALPRFQLGEREFVFSRMSSEKNLITMEWL